MTQTEQVLSHLLRIGPITPLEALRNYGIMRLGARIWDIKRRGWVVNTDIIEVPTAHGGKPARVARYSIQSA